MIPVEVPTHWAKRNFGITALAHAQQFAYDNAKKGEYKIDADGKVINLSKYVNVEGKEVFLKLDNFAVNKVCYRPALKVKYGDMFEKDINGNYIYNEHGSRKPIERPTRIIPEKWLCYSEKANKKIGVTYQYCQENFKQYYLDEVREAGLKKTIKYIAIPPGRSVMPENIPIEIGKGPDQKYYQKEDENTCLTISFSNMLYYCNLQEHANLVFTQRKKFEDCINVWTIFNAFLVKLSPYLQCVKINSELESLQEEHFFTPVITCLKGSDGKMDHTVTIYKGLVFDGNFPYALPLSDQSLNICCSSKEQKVLFVEFRNSYIFDLFDKYLDIYDKGGKNDWKHAKRNKKKNNKRKKHKC